MGTIIAGGWSAYSPQISAEAKKSFDVAMKGLVGVSYQPIAVATQVVSGINYRFICNSKVVYPNARPELSLVEIYQPLSGDAHISSIKKID